jgi:hypothetical protein
VESNRRLGYLGTATIRQRDVKTEFSCALYESEDESRGWFGRYWDPDPEVALRVGPATIRFHDGIDADVDLTRVAPASGAFRVTGDFRDVRKR